jgi:2-keto-4-pentenoate hydratase/2-oxohepta-3-ene-1,7-dioic acid hydratase in catechol pathway
MLLYRTNRGLARGNGEMLDILDVPHHDIAELLAAGRSVIDKAPVREQVARNAVEYLAPVIGRGRLFLNGLNYVDHVNEVNMKLTDGPAFLDINDAGLCDPGTDIIIPAEAPNEVDYEGELVLIVTRAGRDIPAEKAWEHIGGLTVGNDVSARDVQRQGVVDGRVARLDLVQRSKSFPTFKPLGPAVRTTEDLPQPLNLRLQTVLNGVTKQDARTTQMIYDIPKVIEHMSKKYALEVGDIIFSGSPGGTAKADGRFLKVGDVVEITIDEIGTLRSVVAAA